MRDDILNQIEFLTRQRFSAYTTAELLLTPLEKGGSDRKFYRITSPGLNSLIFVQYGRQKEENSHYVELGAFLESVGVRVPQMLLHEAQEGRIWMEDLGELDLWAFREESWENRRSLYQKALREVYRLHRSALERPEAAACLGVQAPFDAHLYQWEQDYFLSHCVARHFGIDPAVIQPERARLNAIALELEGYPRCLVHRDFQSQNIVVQNGHPCLIDFQGMRFGLPQYDLASLLLDPYTHLLGDEREELLRFYYETLAGIADPASIAEFRRVYFLCAAQRLMQALGAYGFLGYEKNRIHFLSYIPVALPRLITVLHAVGGMDSLATLLQRAASSGALHSQRSALKTDSCPC